MKNCKLPLLVGIFLLLTTFLSAANSLLVDAPAPLNAKASSSAELQRYVTLNPKVASTLSTVGSQFDLPLFNGEQFTFQVTRVERDPTKKNAFTIECSVVGQPATILLLAQQNGAYAASFRTKDGRLFQIGTAAGPTHYLRQIDPAHQARCGIKGKTPPTPIFNPPSSTTPVAPAATPSLQPDATAQVTTAPPKPVLDVLVVYTDAARQDAGGTDDAIQSEIALAMAEGQQAFDNSQVNVQIRLVHSEFVDYTDSGSLTVDLARLGNPTDGFLDSAITLRDKYKADILSLWVSNDTNGEAGLAYQLLPNSTLYTYNVIVERDAIGLDVPVHEIGHNFGCDHEQGFSQPTPLYPYAHGYTFQTPDTAFHDTVMTSVARAGRRVHYFSNPNLTYDNGSGPVPLGTSSNYNALVINNTAAKLTSFRIPPGLGEAVDAPTIPWTSGGDNRWFWQPSVTHDGSDAAQSGNISDNQSTYLQGTINGPARLTYWWNVSSESGGDFLSFSIDGNSPLWTASGAGSWQQDVQFIPAGTHTIEWTYAKNGSTNQGADAAWIDQVVVQPLKLPIASITSPAANARVFTPTITVQGTAHDDVQIDHVEYKVQNMNFTTGWQTATGGSNWTAQIDLAAGTNTIFARTFGFGGQVSAIASRSFDFVVTNALTVIPKGNGKFSPDYNGKFLEIGRRYTITAIPSNNWVFSNWSGSISSNGAVLNFFMQSNMVLQGNFITNVYIPVADVYNGLFREPDAVRQSSAGFLTFTMTASGAYNGRMNLDGAAYLFAGRFDLNGNSEVIVHRLHTNSVIIDLSMNLVPPDDTVHGTVSSGPWVANFAGDRAVFNALKNKAVNYAGKYTLAIPGNNDSSVAPGGDSIATVTIDNGGIIHAIGTLADGTPFSQTVSISKNGNWPLFQPLYLLKGMIFGNVTFSNAPATTLGGDITWIKPPTHSAFYSNGFTLNTALVGSSYIPPTNGMRMLNMTNGTATLSGADLPNPIVNPMVLNSNNTITVTGTNGTVLLLNKLNGSLAGSHFTDPVTRRIVPINGVVLQNQTEARGFFLRTNQSGSLLLQP